MSLRRTSTPRAPGTGEPMSPDRSPRVSNEHLRQIRMVDADEGNDPSLLHGNEVVALIDDLADARTRIVELEAALDVAEKVLRRIESGDEGTWNCGCPSGEVATSALAALRPETEATK